MAARPWNKRPATFALSLHLLPHHNLFNLKSPRYQHGLKVLGCQPLFFGSLALIPLMIYMMFKMMSLKQKNRSYSVTKNLQYWIMIICIVAFFVLLILELCLHFAMLKYLPSVIIDIETYPQIEQEIERYLNKLEFIYDLDPKNANEKSGSENTKASLDSLENTTALLDGSENTTAALDDPNPTTKSFEAALLKPPVTKKYPKAPVFKSSEEFAERYRRSLESNNTKETTKKKWANLQSTEKVEDLYKTYESLVKNIVEATNKITKEKAIILPREIQTPLKQEFLTFEWIRFLLAIISWSCGVGFCVSFINSVRKPYMVYAVCGYIFCCVAAGIILIEAVALADLCFQPVDGLTNLQPPDYEKYMNDIQLMLCSVWAAEIHQRVRYVQTLMNQAADIALWNEIRDRRQTDYENMQIDSSWPNNMTRYKIRTEYSYQWFLFFTREELFDLNDLLDDSLDCDAIDEFADDVRPICEDDRILLWLVLQLLPLLVIATACYVLLVLGVSRTKHIKTYVAIVKKKINIDIKCKIPDTMNRFWKYFLMEASTTLICNKCCDDIYLQPSETMDAGTSTNNKSTKEPSKTDMKDKSTDEYPTESTEDSAPHVSATTKTANKRGKKKRKSKSKNIKLVDSRKPTDATLIRDPDTLIQDSDTLTQDSDTLTQDSDKLIKDLDTLIKISDTVIKNPDKLIKKPDKLIKKPDKLKRDSSPKLVEQDSDTGCCTKRLVSSCESLAQNECYSPCRY